MTAAEDRRARNEDVGSGRCRKPVVSSAMPPSTWMSIGRSPIIALTRRIFSSIAGMNFWPPDQVDRHHQNEVDLVEQIVEHAFRRCRIDRDAGLLAKCLDRLHRTVEMGTGFRMDGDAVAARLRKSFEIWVGRRDHQVAIEIGLRVRPQRLDDIRAERDVRDEMAIHDVEMDPVGTGSNDVAHFLSELGVIGGENGGRCGWAGA